MIKCPFLFIFGFYYIIIIPLGNTDMELDKVVHKVSPKCCNKK